ncbi:MAG: hypothetical protein ABH808_02725 [Candidatus Kuenenbacteria bacterium]
MIKKQKIIIWLIFLVVVSVSIGWAVQKFWEKEIKSNSIERKETQSIKKDGTSMSTEIKETSTLEKAQLEEEIIYKLTIYPKQGTQIKTGGVIAYGHYLKPPYDITLENNMIFINGIQCVPSLPRPQVEKKEKISPTVIEWYEKKHEISKQIFSNYKEWMSKYGEEKAKAPLVNFLKKQDIIEDFYFDEYNQLWIKWKNQPIPIGYEVMLLDTALIKKPSKEEIEKDIIESRKNELNFFKKNLEKNKLIIISYSVREYRSLKILKEINKIMEKNIDRKEKEKLLKETKIGHNVELIKHIIYNYDLKEWSELE